MYEIGFDINEANDNSDSNILECIADRKYNKQFEHLHLLNNNLQFIMCYNVMKMSEFMEV